MEIQINDRIVEIRKYYKLNQEDFGDKIGLTKTAISYIESGKRGVTESNIKLICTTYNISEEWLRSGKGEMFLKSETFSLDELIKQRGMDDLELDIIKCYFELDKDTRQAVIKHIKKYFNKNDDNSSKAIDEMSMTSDDYILDSVSEAEEKYKKNVLKNAQKRERIVSNTTGEKEMKKESV